MKLKTQYEGLYDYGFKFIIDKYWYEEYQTMRSIKSFARIDLEKLLKHLNANYDLVKYCFKSDLFQKEGSYDANSSFDYQSRDKKTFDKLFVSVDKNRNDEKLCSVTIHFMNGNTDSVNAANALHEFITSIEVPKDAEVIEKNNVKILIQRGGGAQFVPFKLDSVKPDFQLNYGESFMKHHNEILAEIRKKQPGLMMFDGEPGTGKTSYIKALTHEIDSRPFLYIPNGMVSQIESPGFVSTLLEEKGAVVILEDAESVLLKRDGSNNNLVASILNLADGILGSLLNLTFLITHNAQNADIDEAVMRPGRMKYHHKFERLPIPCAQKLCDHLEIKIKVTRPMTLAEIYNQSNKPLPASRPVIGFSAAKVDMTGL